MKLTCAATRAVKSALDTAAAGVSGVESFAAMSRRIGETPTP